MKLKARKFSGKLSYIFSPQKQQLWSGGTFQNNSHVKIVSILRK
jgi:hypothetical protein